MKLTIEGWMILWGVKERTYLSICMKRRPRGDLNVSGMKKSMPP